MTLRLTLALVAGVLLVPELTAQRMAPVQVGDRVRVAVASGASRTAGALVRLTADTMVVDGTPILRSDIIRIDRSDGRKSRWLRGLGIGFAAGLAAGAIVGAAHPCLDGEFTQLWCAGFFGAIGAVVGAPVGALIGSASHAERWRRVPLDRLSVAAGPTGLQLGFSLSF